MLTPDQPDGAWAYAEAEIELQQSFESLKKAKGQDHAWTRRSIAALVDLYDAVRMPEKAAEFRAMLPPAPTTEPASRPR